MKEILQNYGNDILAVVAIIVLCIAIFIRDRIPSVKRRKRRRVIRSGRYGWIQEMRDGVELWGRK